MTARKFEQTVNLGWGQAGLMDPAVNSDRQHKYLVAVLGLISGIVPSLKCSSPVETVASESVSRGEREGGRSETLQCKAMAGLGV